MKINVYFKVVLNSGAALIIWGLGFFGILWMAQHHPAIEGLVPVVLPTWTAGFGGYLVKQNADNKLDVQVAKEGTGDNLNRIKTQAAGVAVAARPDSCDTTNGAK